MDIGDACKKVEEKWGGSTSVGYLLIEAAKKSNEEMVGRIIDQIKMIDGGVDEHYYSLALRFSIIGNNSDNNLGIIKKLAPDVDFSKSNPLIFASAAHKKDLTKMNKTKTIKTLMPYAKETEIKAGFIHSCKIKEKDITRLYFERTRNDLLLEGLGVACEWGQDETAAEIVKRIVGNSKKEFIDGVLMDKDIQSEMPKAYKYLMDSRTKELLQENIGRGLRRRERHKI